MVKIHAVGHSYAEEGAGGAVAHPHTGASDRVPSRRCRLLPWAWGSCWQTLAHLRHVRAPYCPEMGLLPTKDNVQNHFTTPRIRLFLS